MDLKGLFSFKWLVGLVGTAFLLFLSWIISVYSNWHNTNKIYKELVEIKKILKEQEGGDVK